MTALTKQKCAVHGLGIQKKFKGFALDIPELTVPAGYATALIGENGAGKTTLLNILMGLRLDAKGELTYFGTRSAGDREKHGGFKEEIGYTGPGSYYMPNWTIKQVEEVCELLFSNFHRDRFEALCRELAVFDGADAGDRKKKISVLSDGTRTKLMLAGVMARDTRLLLLDEPASPLDPLMRDKLCQMIQDYLSEDSSRSVLFSTHNILDMEHITDYAIIMAHGQIAEQGFVEELKEKYVLVKGEKEDAEAAKGTLYSMSAGPYGFEGLCLTSRLEELTGIEISAETPSLYQISIAVIKETSRVKLR